MYGVFVCDMKSPFSVLGPSRPGEGTSIYRL